jgi:hypothetical protein
LIDLPQLVGDTETCYCPTTPTNYIDLLYTAIVVQKVAWTSLKISSMAKYGKCPHSVTWLSLKSQGANIAWNTMIDHIMISMRSRRKYEADA